MFSSRRREKMVVKDFRFKYQNKLIMARNQNTDRDGNIWSESTKKAVWSKGLVITDYPPDTWRYDKYGKVMKYSEHGNRDS